MENALIAPVGDRLHFRVDPATPRLCARENGEEFDLPALWLRERCQDAAHLDPQTHQRLFDPHRLPEDLALTAVESDGGGRIRLTFSDGYQGSYDLALLEQEIRPDNGLPDTLAWDARLNRSELFFDWAKTARPSYLHAVLGAFLSRGFVVLRNVPTDPERILEVARTFGHLRETNFGTYFEVYSRPVSNDLAYSSHALGPHTDNPYRDPVPGIQLLHCLTNETSGGLSTLVDSLAIGSALAEEDPEGFERLATTPVQFRFADADEVFVETRCIIRRDELGRMTGMHYSPRLDYMPLVDAPDLRAFQRARHRLSALLTDPRFEIRFSLAAGELLMFDNSRVLHGRTAFDAREGRRHLQGCYIDIDEPRSRYRNLSRRLQPVATNREAG